MINEGTVIHMISWKCKKKKNTLKRNFSSSSYIELNYHKKKKKVEQFCVDLYILNLNLLILLIKKRNLAPCSRPLVEGI